MFGHLICFQVHQALLFPRQGGLHRPVHGHGQTRDEEEN